MKESDRLSHLETLWSVVNRAHGDVTVDAQSARQKLIDRYGGAIRRYLMGALRNENDADEVYQEFALKLVRGDFQRADPSRGQFRKFVKTALFRMIVDFQRAKGKIDAQRGLEDQNEPSESAHTENDFTQDWRKELIDKTFHALLTQDRACGNHMVDILRIRIDNPSLRSPEMAKLAGERLGKSISPENFRALLRRARVRFAEILLQQVAQTLRTPSPEELEMELAELNLLDYCKPALEDRA